MATDHCPFTSAKNAGLAGGGWNDFTQIPGGVPGIETRLALIYQKVVEGHLGLTEWVDRCCTTPAKLFGLHPRKGQLVAGADGDVVIFDPTAERPLVAERLHMNVDYSPYEDLTVRGWPSLVLARASRRRDGEPVAAEGWGRFVARGPSGRPDMSRYDENSLELHVARPARPPTERRSSIHRRLPGYERSPLLEARALAAELGLGRLWVKDESSRLDLPSFKILGASWGVYRALDQHLGGLGEWATFDELAAQLESHLPLALAAATDGNHGRAVARMAKLLGLSARIFVPAGTAAARIEGIESEGASCEVVDGSYDDAVERSAQEAGERCLVISDTSWPGYEDVPRWVIEGYSTIFWEIEDQLSERARTSPTSSLSRSVWGHSRPPRFDTSGGRSVTSHGGRRARGLGLRSRFHGGGQARHDPWTARLDHGRPQLRDTVSGCLARCVEWLRRVRRRRRRAGARGMQALAREDVVSGETGAAGIACLLELLDGPPGAPRASAPEHHGAGALDGGGNRPRRVRGIVGQRP